MAFSFFEAYPGEMNWRWRAFSELSTDDLYDLIKLREEAFVVEQKCIYLECDGWDRKAMHLLGYESGRLAAYMRAFPAGLRYPEMCLGRVVVRNDARGQGVGRKLLAEGLRQMRQAWGWGPVRISAQSHLLRFYQDFGFVPEGEEYLDDGIPHRYMVCL
jgi:ElaA protein